MQYALYDYRLQWLGSRKSRSSALRLARRLHEHGYRSLTLRTITPHGHVLKTEHGITEHYPSFYRRLDELAARGHKREVQEAMRERALTMRQMECRVGRRPRDMSSTKREPMIVTYNGLRLKLSEVTVDDMPPELVLTWCRDAARRGLLGRDKKAYLNRRLHNYLRR